MAALDQIVQVVLTAQTTAVPTASFSIPLILGSTANGWSGGDYVHAYTDPADMLTDGYSSSSPEYIDALAAFSQTVTPAQVLVGKRGTAAAQSDTLVVNTLTVGHAYSVSVNGAAYSATASGGDTQQSILGTLRTAIIAAQPLTGVVTGTGASASLALTSTIPGQAVTYTAIDPLLTHATVTANAGISSDLANVAAQNPSWYGLATPGASDAEILQAATWVEANKKLYVAVTSTSAVATTATTDLGSVLKSKGFKRTALAFSPANVVAGFGAAWLGSQLPLTPGSSNWAFRTLAGQTADTLTGSQVAACIGSPIDGIRGKNVNVYQQVGPANITQMGTTASGQYIDITVGLDWLESTLQANIYALIVNNLKIPYTDSGVTQLMSGVRSAVDTGVVNGLIDGDSPISVTAPRVLTVATNQRANRIGPPVSFACRLQGAQNSVQVLGTVNV